MKVTQYLWFEKDMDAAIRLYTTLIGGSTIDWDSSVGADNPSGPAGSVKMVGFTLGDQRYMAIQAGPLDPFNRSFSIMVQCENQAEVDRLWAALTEGLSWQIVPKRLGELMADPDRAKARRVTEAMLKMGKLDIAGLEAAARG